MAMTTLNDDKHSDTAIFSGFLVVYVSAGSSPPSRRSVTAECIVSNPGTGGATGPEFSVKCSAADQNVKGVHSSADQTMTIPICKGQSWEIKRQGGDGDIKYKFISIAEMLRD